MNLVIRRAVSTEAEAILAFWHMAGTTPSPIDTPDSIRRAVDHPSAVLLVAEDAHQQMVGTLLGTFDGWRANLYRLAVHPDRRREGIARSLVRRMEGMLAARGAQRADAVVDIDNTASLALCRTLGYELDEVGRRHRRYLPASPSED